MSKFSSLTRVSKPKKNKKNKMKCEEEKKIYVKFGATYIQFFLLSRFYENVE